MLPARSHRNGLEPCGTAALMLCVFPKTSRFVRDRASGHWNEHEIGRVMQLALT